MRTAAALAETLRQALAEHASISIDTTNVESIDVATLQVLVSAARAAAAQNRALSLRAAADSPVAGMLVRAGIFSGNGAHRVSSLPTWTITREAA